MHEYRSLDPTRDFCEGVTEKVPMDPVVLLRDMSEALYLVRRSMKMMEDDTDLYTQGRLESVADLLDRVINGYATAPRNDLPQFVVEMAQARLAYRQQQKELE